MSPFDAYRPITEIKSEAVNVNFTIVFLRDDLEHRAYICRLSRRASRALDGSGMDFRPANIGTRKPDLRNNGKSFTPIGARLG